MADNNVRSQRDKAVESALKQIERNFGKGAIMRLGSQEAAQDVPAISTGSLGLDIATGVGGVPRGRVTEIYGPESSGKTTLALHVIAEAQKAGGWPPLSTRSTPWTWATPASWGSMWTTCW